MGPNVPWTGKVGRRPTSRSSVAPGVSGVVTRCAFLVVALMLLASPTWATNYYVSQTDGNDNYNGTEPTHTTGFRRTVANHRPG